MTMVIMVSKSYLREAVSFSVFSVHSSTFFKTYCYWKHMCEYFSSWYRYVHT